MIHLRLAAPALALIVGMGALSTLAVARAEDAPAPTKHQLMKDCMAKQKASDGGIPKEQMKKNCRDVTSTEQENDKAEKESAAKSTAASAPGP